MPRLLVLGSRKGNGVITIREVEPEREPPVMAAVTVGVNVPPGVERIVAIDRGVVVGVEGLVGNAADPASVTVLGVGAPDWERVTVLGRPIAVEPDSSEIVTVYGAVLPTLIVDELGVRLTVKS